MVVVFGNGKGLGSLVPRLLTRSWGRGGDAPSRTRLRILLVVLVREEEKMVGGDLQPPRVSVHQRNEVTLHRPHNLLFYMSDFRLCVWCVCVCVRAYECALGEGVNIAIEWTSISILHQF